MNLFKGKELTIFPGQQRQKALKSGIMAVRGCEKTAEAYCKDLDKMPAGWRRKVELHGAAGLFCSSVALEPVGPIKGEKAEAKLSQIGAEPPAVLPAEVDTDMLKQARLALQIYDLEPTRHVVLEPEPEDRLLNDIRFGSFRAA